MHQDENRACGRFAEFRRESGRANASRSRGVQQTILSGIVSRECAVFAWRTVNGPERIGDWVADWSYKTYTAGQTERFLDRTLAS